MGQPIDVANAVVFLFRDEASFINGSVIYLEGGHALPASLVNQIGPV